jgi:hypothetical protein
MTILLLCFSWQLDEEVRQVTLYLLQDRFLSGKLITSPKWNPSLSLYYESAHSQPTQRWNPITPEHVISIAEAGKWYKIWVQMWIWRRSGAVICADICIELRCYLGFCAGRTEVNKKKKLILQSEFNGVSLHLDEGAEILITSIATAESLLEFRRELLKSYFTKNLIG